ncbi:sigma-54-dependent Fis family transcriptional regulator [Dyadobacter fermentans]|uniref:sigma-54-dependent Fis family transcriptional regulator n=1 Tax=Dyadobacter fermentans TaxID=94254 RepID=UPI001CBA766D|nr:sigma 54-interacting transcriptional regulator [Dyadobacter fermentans]MBZ1363049.1 sigma 54-interacting transcriptional regulator [Dyadobacter fermentans]
MKAPTRHDHTSPDADTGTLEFLEKQRRILLDLSDDITQIRDKNDLIVLFSSRIKDLFYFKHTIVTLIDPERTSYRPFLLDPASSPIQNHPSYPELVISDFPLSGAFIEGVLEAGKPVLYRMADVMDLPGSPTFLRVNYERGIREILMTPLKSKNETMGFLHMYTDRPGSITDEFISIIDGIAPQISSAVTNIIKNDEIREKEWINEVLLECSSGLATVRSREELAAAVRNTLVRFNLMRGFGIRRVNADRETMSTYVHEAGAVDFGAEALMELTQSQFPVEDGLQNRIMASSIPLQVNIDAEIRRGLTSRYLFLWQEMGLKTMVGIALRNGDVTLGILWLAIEQADFSLLQGIASQISIAMSNVLAAEEIAEREREKAFLLNFSNDVARVRTKEDLKNAVYRVLSRIMNVKLAMISLIDDDGSTLKPFMYDSSLFENAGEQLDALVTASRSIHEPLAARVLAAEQYVVLDLTDEMRNCPDNAFLQLWQRTGRRYMFTAPLRSAQSDLGTLWLLTDSIKGELMQGICSQISTAIANIQANEKILAYKRMLEMENSQLKEQIKRTYNFNEIVGSGPEMQQVYGLISMVSESSSTVLITGETGTGKELIARAIHNTSPRKDKLMIKVNCAALPANLIESELFGHEKGAFTGALERRIGKFELADNSTLFLDEIGEMPLEAQVKLLRVLQEKELERIGGKTTVKVNVRIIAATNRNLAEEVQAGRFRSDLYYRLNVFPIHLPPLRDRRDDIAPLAHLFVDRYSKATGRKIRKISPKVLQELTSYPWPGNVRELEHLMERSVLLTTAPVIQEVYLPGRGQTHAAHSAALNGTLEEVERLHIIETMRRCGGKLAGRGGAAEYLGVPATTLHSKIKKLGINKKQYYAAASRDI